MPAKFAVLPILAATGWLLLTPLLKGQDARSAFQAGLEAASKGDNDKAISSFTEALAFDPKYSPAYNNRGNIYKAKGDCEKAIADYDQAIRFDPTYVPAYINRGIAYAAKGDGDDAMSDYNVALRLDPANALALVNRGVLRESGGDYRKAIADFASAIQIDSKNGLAYNNLAWVLATCPEEVFRDGKKAVDLATKACELAQWENPDWMDTLAAACAEAGDFAQAIKLEGKYLATPNLTKADAAAASGRLQLYQAQKAYHAAMP